LLLRTDNGASTVWHVVAYKGYSENLQNIWEWANENLTTEEITNKLLLGTDNVGSTALHWAAPWGNLKLSQQLR
jgi:hypothetical protein